MKRVNWYRSRCKMLRAQEEEGILKRELESVQRFYGYQSDRWMTYSRAQDAESWPGFTAFCKQKAAFFGLLQADATATFHNLYEASNVI